MGLAASQARFLGITLRKANCEYKSTELAQQRLELTNQMTDIAQEYANAMNATKLVWHNDMVCDSFGNPTDFGLSYSLLMMPSAANDYNPYMFSTRSGAIVLNSKYAAAAKAAGISEGGGVPSAEGRKAFLNELATSSVINGVDQHDNVITRYTYDILEQTKGADGQPVAPLSRNTSPEGVIWHSGAGMGAKPLNKSDSGLTHLTDLVKNSNIGGREVDWLQIERALDGFSYNTATTTAQEALDGNSYKGNITKARSNLRSEEAAKPDSDPTKMSRDDVSLYSQAAEKMVQLVMKGTAFSEAEVQKIMPQPKADDYKTGEYILDGSANPKYQSAYTQWKQQYDVFKAYCEETYNSLNGFKDLKARQEALKNVAQNDAQRQQLKADLANATKTAKNKLCYAIFQKADAEQNGSGEVYGWEGKTTANHTVNIDDLFNTHDSRIVEDPRTYGGNSETDKKIFDKLTLAVNDVICTDASAIKSLTIADLLTSNVVLTAHGGEAVQSVGLSAKAIMDYIAAVFGCNNPGVGLNVDDESSKALEKALSTVKKLFLSQGSAVAKGEDTKSTNIFGYTYTISTNDSSLNLNQAYRNANDFNRIGTNNDRDYAAVNISNMVSAFLTYYDNYLRGSESTYIVGKGNTDGKTSFVTDDPNYVYVASNTEALTNDEKIADFFNQLYNNICEHGWRYDDMVQDSEHLESAVKDGRYQIMELHGDGYFYQMRYNDIGYMEEVHDDDAVARAESDYQIKKAQITFKEDQIDVKTKKLDAEITELNTEINSVQNIISKNIEKVFSMFSN